MSNFPFFTLTASFLFGKRRSRGLLHRPGSSMCGGSLYRRKGGGGSEERKLLYMREIRYIGLFFMGKFFVLPLFAQRR